MPHASADLEVHTDRELEEILGAPVRTRTQVRAWPRSWVELLELETGDRLVHKTQRLLSVEPDFYAQCGPHPLLPRCTQVVRSESWSALVMEYLERPLDVGAHPEQVVGAAREIVDAIGSLPKDAPAYVSIGSTDASHAEVDWTSAGLAALVAIAGSSRDVVWIISANLLEDRGVPPLAHVAPAVVGLRWFLLLRWAVVAKLNLIPSMPLLFDEWAASAVTGIRAAAGQELA